MKAFLVTEKPPRSLTSPAGIPRALIVAGWAPSALIAAGWVPHNSMVTWLTPNDLASSGWGHNDLIAAGWVASALIAAGWAPSALIAAGWSTIALQQAQEEWDSIPVLLKPYSRLLKEIEVGKRKHDQSTFGTSCDPKGNLCGTRMCTAGHLVNMAGEIGYRLKNKYGWVIAARLIHMKSRPDVPPQNFGAIPQDLAMAYIQARAAEEINPT